MLVAISGFGSIWRSKIREAGALKSTAQFAYYNSTGVLVRGVVRQRPRISGVVRFNGDSGLDPNYPYRSLERIFECAEPCIWQGENKLLFKRKVTGNPQPQMFLVVLGFSLHGLLPIGKDDWRSPDTWLISFSEFRNQQEALVLAPPHAWFRTMLGLWRLQSLACPAQYRLQLIEPASALEVR